MPCRNNVTEVTPDKHTVRTFIVLSDPFTTLPETVTKLPGIPQPGSTHPANYALKCVKTVATISKCETHYIVVAIYNANG